MPHNYLLEARYKYMKCPRTSKWVQYTTIANYDGQIYNIIVDESNRSLLEPSSNQTSKDLYYSGGSTGDSEFTADPGPIAYYQPVSNRARAEDFGIPPTLCESSQSSFSSESGNEGFDLSDDDGPDEPDTQS